MSDIIVAQFSMRVFVAMGNSSALRHFPFLTSWFRFQFCNAQAPKPDDYYCRLVPINGITDLALVGKRVIRV